MRLMPPSSTTPAKTAITTPLNHRGMPKASRAAWATELAWTVLPIPKPARKPNRAKAVAIQSHFGPRPSLM